MEIIYLNPNRLDTRLFFLNEKCSCGMAASFFQGNSCQSSTNKLNGFGGYNQF